MEKTTFAIYRKIRRKTPLSKQGPIRFAVLSLTRSKPYIFSSGNFTFDGKAAALCFVEVDKRR
jgi:hypothetical protein